MSIMGQTAATQFSNVAVKMSTFQMAQVQRSDEGFPSLQMHFCFHCFVLSAVLSRQVSRPLSFRAAQVYAASIMFGYFLRRVDKRFQLSRSMGTLPMSKDDAVARLEKLFSMADAEDTTGSRTDSESPASANASPSASSPDSGSSSNLPVKKEKSALKRYVEVHAARTCMSLIFWPH